MSTPMYEMPEHFPMPLNKKEQGPETDASKVVKVVCWCWQEGCTKYKEH